MKKAYVSIIVAVLIVVAAVILFGRDGDVSPEIGGEAREVVVFGTEFSFSPSTVEVLPGETVRLTFNNEGLMDHDLVIEGLGVATPIVAPEQSSTVEFRAPENRDEYPLVFFCSISGHREAGMEGIIVAQ